MTKTHYQFGICGKDESVDFRSHVSIYAINHGLTGWIRNSCNKCVYGMFSGDKTESDQLAAILTTPNQIKSEIDKRVDILKTTVTSMDQYPPANNNIPMEYLTDFKVDWSYHPCEDPVSCLPTNYSDCQQTIPLPPNGTWTIDCMRYPLGTDKNRHPDCNSINKIDGKPCFTIKNGTIVETIPNCQYSNSFAASKCCTPFNTKLLYGRDGLFNPPGTLDKCTVVQTNKSDVPGSYKYPCDKSVKKKN